MQMMQKRMDMMEMMMQTMMDQQGMMASPKSPVLRPRRSQAQDRQPVISRSMPGASAFPAPLDWNRLSAFY